MSDIRNLSGAALLLILIASLPLGGAKLLAAQEPELPEPGITPDSWLYGFKRFFESLDLFFTFDDAAKARKLVNYAELRLSEAKAMIEAGKYEYVSGLVEEYSGNLREALNIAERMGVERKAELTELVAVSTTKHIFVLDRVEELVPDEAKTAIALAKEKSIRGNIEALRALAHEKPERACEIALEIAKARVEKVKHYVKTGKPSMAIELIEEYKQYIDLGSEIADIAELNNKSSTRILEVTIEASSLHMEGLIEALESAPEGCPAIPYIEDALRYVESKQEKAMEIYMKRLGIPMPQMPEELPEMPHMSEEMKKVVERMMEKKGRGQASPVQQETLGGCGWPPDEECP